MPTLDDRLVAIGDALELGVARVASRRRVRRRTLRITAVATMALVVAVGSALAASSVLGGPAPATVQSAVDSFYPDQPGESLAPAPGGATAVATFGDDVLYRLPARDSNSVCLVVVLAHKASAKPIPGEGCVARFAGWLPLGLVGLGSGDDRQLIFGQADAPASATLVLETSGEAPVQIPLGKDGFFLTERTTDPPNNDPAAQTYVPSRLVLRSASGAELQSHTLSHLLLPGHPTTS